MAEEKKKSVKSLIGDIGRQREENDAAIKKMESGVRKIYASIKEMRNKIKEQVSINAAAIQEINVGIKKIISGIKPKKAKIDAFANEVKTFIKEFYG